jgi:hypothetical protein
LVGFNVFTIGIGAIGAIGVNVITTNINKTNTTFIQRPTAEPDVASPSTRATSLSNVLDEHQNT